MIHVLSDLLVVALVALGVLIVALAVLIIIEKIKGLKK